MSVILDWTPDKAARFGRETLTFRHALHERAMFADSALEELLDAYPRERLGVFTMGDDPTDWRSWRRGAAAGLSGSRLLEAARTGRIWLNLRHANDHLPLYAALCDEVFADKTAAGAPKTFKRDLGVLISSPNAQVFYHFDVPLVSLWQIRGCKRVWLYPVATPFVDAPTLEGVVLRERAEQTTFDPGWDRAAQSVALTPGDMVTWAQNAPHRIENGPMLNVSLSMEFMTPPALRRARVLYANGLLRRRLGVRPRSQTAEGAAALAKIALAGAVKIIDRSQGGRGRETGPPVSFHLQAGAERLPGVHS